MSIETFDGPRWYPWPPDLEELERRQVLELKRRGMTPAQIISRTGLPAEKVYRHCFEDIRLWVANLEENGSATL